MLGLLIGWWALRECSTATLDAMVLGTKVSLGGMPFTTIQSMYSPGAVWVWGFIAWLNDSFNWIPHVLIVVVFCFGALYLNQVLILTEALPQRSVLPALLFAILMVALKELHFPLSPILGFAPALYVLGAFLNAQKKIREDVLALKTGLALGIGLLFDFSLAPFVVFSLLVFLLQISSSLRILGLHLYGVGLPLVGAWVFFRFQPGEPHFAESIELFFSSSALLRGFDCWIDSGAWLLGIFFLFSFLKAVFFTRLLHAQLRTQWILFFWLLGSIASALLAPATQGWASWMYAMPAVTYFVAQEVMLTQSNWMAELKFWVFLIAACFILLGRSHAVMHSYPSARALEEASSTLYLHGTPSGMVPGAGGPYFHPYHARQLLQQVNTPSVAKRLYLEMIPDMPKKVHDTTGLFQRALIILPALGEHYKADETQTMFIRD